MPRPTLLIAEPEPLEALSTRKLVVETAKFNVITAHSTQEAVELFHLFPKVSAAVLVQGDKLQTDEIAEKIKSASPEVPIICLDPRDIVRGKLSDYNLSSHEPLALVRLLREIFGDPRDLDTAQGSHKS